jgi:hypothetical protein
VYFHFPGDYLRALPTRPAVTDANNNIGLTLPATISDTLPDVSEVVTVTAPAGFHFDPATAVLVGGNPAIITSLGAGGSSVSFVPLPGAAGVPQIDGVVPDAAPLNILTMPVENNVTVPSEVPTLPGATDPTTAPPLSTPGVGEVSVLFDKPDYESTLDAFYKLAITEAGTYTITMDWDVGDDVDMFLCGDPLASDFSNCDFTGATGAHPEVVPFDLAPGDYIVVADDFGQFAGGVPAIGATLVITIQHDPPAGPGVALRKAAPVDPAKLQRLQLRR